MSAARMHRASAASVAGLRTAPRRTASTTASTSSSASAAAAPRAAALLYAAAGLAAAAAAERRKSRPSAAAGFSRLGKNGVGSADAGIYAINFGGGTRPPAARRPTRAFDGGEGGLADLLQRDRKNKVDLDRAVAAFGGDDADETSAAAASAAVAVADAAPAPPARAARRARADRQRAAAAAADGARGGRKGRRDADKDAASSSASSAAAPSGPRRCKEAIDAGVSALAAGDADTAVAFFNLALELPGNGAFRLPGRAREYSCPSDAEEQAALYNLSCAYAYLSNKAQQGGGGQGELLDAAAECLEAACDAGFSDWATMLSDPDLQPLGEARLRAIADARRGAGAAVRGMLGALPVIGGGGAGGGEGGGGKGGPAPEVKVSDLRGKPWIMW